jgi:hypothetical protein
VFDSRQGIILFSEASSSGYMELFPRSSSRRGMKLTIRLYLGLSLRILGVVAVLSLYVSIARFLI